MPKLSLPVHALGRLDADTSGLLLFTNDTDFAAQVAEGTGSVEEVYRARLRGRVSPGTPARFESGIVLDGRRRSRRAAASLV